MSAPEKFDIGLGHDHFLEFTRWAPDRRLNPQYADLPDVEKYGAIVSHKKADGTMCDGCITFDGQAARHFHPQGPCWTVESWDPLTLSPSLLCNCGDHGFIRGGVWVPC